MVSVIRLAVFLAAFSVCGKTRATLALHTKNCQAATKPGPGNAVNCTANYTSTVNFTCPPGITGDWKRWRGPDNDSVLCNGDIGRSCDYSGGDGKLWYSDDGLYFCRNVYNITQQHFVRLSVHAPPMLKDPPPLHIHACSRKKHFCDTNDMIRHPSDKVTLSAVFYSPLPVSFELYHNESEINCSALEYCSLETNNTTISITLDSNHFYGNRSDPGLYSFDISNDLGYNTSRTTLAFQCTAPTNPIPQTESKNVTLTTDKPANVSCKLAMVEGYYMYMCLVNESVTITEDNFDAYTNSCAWCTWEQCFSMHNRPTWSFKERDDPSSPYCRQFTMSAYIPNASISDNNTKLICAWGDDVDRFICKGCTIIKLKVTDPEPQGGASVQPYVYVVGCVGGAVLIMISGMVAVGVVVVVVGMRSKRKRKHRRRRAQQPGVCAIKEESSSDADDEGQPINRSHTIESYGAALPPDMHRGCHECGDETEAPLDEVHLLSSSGDESAHV